VKLLARGGNAWHLIEFAIGVGAGIAARSVALVGFGIARTTLLALQEKVPSTR